MNADNILCGKRVATLTLGCKVNQYETEGMRELLGAAGCQFVAFEEKADIYLVNTCSVTNIAERKSRQMLHKAKKLNPESIVVAAGCYVQTVPQEVLEDLAVDLVVGNNHKKEIVEILSRYIDHKSAPSPMEIKQKAINPKVYDTQQLDKEGKKNEDMEPGAEQDNALQDALRKTQEDKMCWNPAEEHTEYENMHVTHMTEHVRAYVKIQDGCNQFCSYCIIPYVRGRIRSRQIEEIVTEVDALAKDGCKEIVLTGIHISSYGKDWKEETLRSSELNGETLLALIDELCKIEGILRIRLGSLEPRIMTEPFIKALAAYPKVCPHFHLSLQSACNATLQRMNRKYTVEDYQAVCDMLRAVYDRPAITTDVIVGFPGETEEEFEETLRNLENLNLYEIHVFKYSPRRGTVAEKMKDQVSPQEKNRRSDILLALTAKQKRMFEESFDGEEVEVLVEEKVASEYVNEAAGMKSGRGELLEQTDNVYVGQTERYMRLEFRHGGECLNRMVKVKLNE